MRPIWVVPARDTDAYLVYGRELALRLGFPFRPRKGKTIRQLQEILDSALLVVHSQGCYYRDEHIILRYHMGLAPLRLLQLQRMKTDYLLEALDLRGDETIIDTTFGLGADALVAASRLNSSNGHIIGLESSPPIFYVASEGLRYYEDETGQITRELCRKIELVNQDYQSYLANLADSSVDIVYFDPMFRDPVAGSVHLEGIRNLGNHEILTSAAILEAMRVSRKKVVIKERRDTPLWSQWPIHHVIGGKYSNVAYGVIECEN